MSERGEGGALANVLPASSKQTWGCVRGQELIGMSCQTLACARMVFVLFWEKVRTESGNTGSPAHCQSALRLCMNDECSCRSF